jgi:RNA recognition motif-containing protein
MTEETKKEETIEAPVSAEDKAEDPLSEEDLIAVERIKERLQFFFSNANVRQDMFLRKLLTSEEKAVPVEVMLRFNTIKKLSQKPEVVLKAAKELNNLLVVDEEKLVIRRVVPFSNDMMKENLHLSLHAKNLPIKEETISVDDRNQIVKKYDVHVDEIRCLFEKYGDVALVKLQFVSDDGGKHNGRDSPVKKRQKHPAGTALIEFRSEEDLKNAAQATLTVKEGEKLEPKEKVILPASEFRKEPVELDVMLFSEFLQSKRNHHKDNSRKNKKRGRDEADDDDAKEPHASPKYAFDWKPGCVIKLKGVPDGCDREAMLECLATGLGTDVEGVKSRKIYVDFSRGQRDGAIRFPEPSDIIGELTKRLKEGELKINNSKVEEVYILDGDEETQYWENFIAFKTRQNVQRHDNKKQRSHRSR